MKLGIIGGGTVGRATARAFIEHVDEVRVYDVVKERATHSLDDVLACDLVMVCLPTPQRPDSLECDAGVVEDFLGGVAGPQCRTANLVIRSTVPVGFTRTMRHRYNLPNLAHSPEFLTARVAVTDAQLPARNIIGVPDGGKGKGPLFSGDNGAAQRLNVLYHQRFPGVPCVLCTSDESEAAKLFQNAFFATKIAFWNECRALSDALGLNWDVVLQAVLLDGRISHSHTSVPGPDGKYGFGGACLPKDLANLIACIEAAGLTPHVTDAAYDRNAEDRKR